jgi:hypothetical protein
VHGKLHPDGFGALGGCKMWETFWQSDDSSGFVFLQVMSVVGTIATLFGFEFGMKKGPNNVPGFGCCQPCTSSFFKRAIKARRAYQDVFWFSRNKEKK